MATKSQFATIQAQVRALTAECHSLRSDLAVALREAGVAQTKVTQAIAAAVRQYDDGHAAGYKSGAFDALCPVSPDHPKALAAGFDCQDADVIAYRDHLTAAIAAAHRLWCQQLRTAA